MYKKDSINQHLNNEHKHDQISGLHQLDSHVTSRARKHERQDPRKQAGSQA